jgi:serine/threonine protein phosphatase PrpC
MVTPTHYICANAGDSRSVFSRKGGQVIALSEDHKPDNPGEKARIEAAGGFVEENRVNGSLNLSRSMGDFEYKSNKQKNFKEQMVTVFPEIKTIERHEDDDLLVLACDGIWDCLNNEDCVAMLKDYVGNDATKKTSLNIEEMFDKIIAKDIMASCGVGTDNMTCVLVKFMK